MSDSNSKGGIPAWQRQGSGVPPPSQPKQANEQPNAEREQTPATQDNASLLDHAKKFLQDGTLLSEPLEKKREFLKSKGLSDSIIEEAVTALGMEETKQTPANDPSRVDAELDEAFIKHPIAQPEVPERPSQPAPIITYPEHLVSSTKPPPIVTTSRLLTTAYAATGTAALFWGLNRYLVEPMFKSLSASRHDFAGDVQEHLDKLNEKLGDTVSVDPASLAVGREARASKKNKDEDDDAASEDSDPTELFHRDYGTQTEELPSSSSSETDDSDKRTQESTLETLSSLCASITTANEEERITADEVQASLKIFTEQLESMALPGTTFNPYDFAAGKPAFTSVYGNGVNGNGNGKKKDEDEVNKMKAEIRGVKGVLLSARNFPSASSSIGGRRAAFPPAVNGSSVTTSAG